MKKYLCFAVLCGFSLALSGCGLFGGKDEVSEPAVVVAPEIPAEALEPEFSTPEQGFKVQGPEGWVKQPGHLGSLVTYLNPRAGEDFKENISLAREPKTDLDLTAYTDESVKQVELFFETYELLGREAIEVAGQAGSRIRYKVEAEGLVIISEQLIIDRPDNWLVVTYIAAADQFEASYPGLKTVESSMRFIDA